MSNTNINVGSPGHFDWACDQIKQTMDSEFPLYSTEQAFTRRVTDLILKNKGRRIDSQTDQKWAIQTLINDGTIPVRTSIVNALSVAFRQSRYLDCQAYRNEVLQLGLKLGTPLYDPGNLVTLIIELGRSNKWQANAFGQQLDNQKRERMERQKLISVILRNYAAVPSRYRKKKIDESTLNALSTDDLHVWDQDVVTLLHNANASKDELRADLRASTISDPRMKTDSLSTTKFAEGPTSVGTDRSDHTPTNPHEDSLFRSQSGGEYTKREIYELASNNPQRFRALMRTNLERVNAILKGTN